MRRVCRREAYTAGETASCSSLCVPGCQSGAGEAGEAGEAGPAACLCALAAVAGVDWCGHKLRSRREKHAGNAETPSKKQALRRPDKRAPNQNTQPPPSRSPAAGAPSCLGQAPLRCDLSTVCCTPAATSSRTKSYRCAEIRSSPWARHAPFFSCHSLRPSRCACKSRVRSMACADVRFAFVGRMCRAWRGRASKAKGSCRSRPWQVAPEGQVRTSHLPLPHPWQRLLSYLHTTVQ